MTFVLLASQQASHKQASQTEDETDKKFEVKNLSSKKGTRDS